MKNFHNPPLIEPKSIKRQVYQPFDSEDDDCILVETQDGQELNQIPKIEVKKEKGPEKLIIKIQNDHLPVERMPDRRPEPIIHNSTNQIFTASEMMPSMAMPMMQPPGHNEGGLLGVSPGLQENHVDMREKNIPDYYRKEKPPTNVRSSMTYFDVNKRNHRAPNNINQTPINSANQSSKTNYTDDPYGDSKRQNLIKSFEFSLQDSLKRNINILTFYDLYVKNLDPPRYRTAQINNVVIVDTNLDGVNENILEVITAHFRKEQVAKALKVFAGK